ncbi:MAG: metallopeptidase TldD-related protein [Myxococcota bacterium]|nr:metallopeptidase TldD-related protein [Myxococcota bacterium]
MGESVGEFAKESGDAILESEGEGLAYFSRFGVDEGLIRAAIERALSRGGSYAELFFEHKISQDLGLQDGAVNRAYSGVALGVGVRVLRGDQTGYAFTEDLSRGSLLETAGIAALIADDNPRSGPTRFEHQQRPNRYSVKTLWGDVGVDEKIPVLRQLNEEAFAADSRIQKVNVGLSHSDGAVLIANSRGRLHFDRRPMTRMSMSCVAEDGGRRESNGANIAARAGWELVNTTRLETLRADAVDQTLRLFEASQGPAGAMPIVLGAGASGILLHEAIGHGFEADFNRKGTSIYSDQLNEMVTHEEVTIIDDGTRPGDRGAVNIDDEGNEGQRTLLIDSGRLCSYIHDKMSAEHYQVAPTGNGRRQSFRHAPLPRMRCTYMEAGQRSPEEIIASVERGIYAETFTNGQVNIGGGDFTFYIKLGYLIEGGKLTQPIKDTNIIGNGPEVLRRTDMVGNDLRFDEGGWVCGKDGQSVPVSLGMPTVRVSEIIVGGQNQSGEGSA